ncbi:hypothetical protein M5689_001019 [Euphorbia peplus]|nr:hypothetical protein M5689_001019 [Euphorbia peplus]
MELLDKESHLVLALKLEIIVAKYSFIGQGTWIFTGFTRLCKALVAGHIVVRLLPLAIAYLALVHAKMWNPRKWRNKLDMKAGCQEMKSVLISQFLLKCLIY